MDLAVEWRARRWRRLLNIIDRLPRTSQYQEAIAEDDEMADLMLAVEDDPDPDRPHARPPVRRLTEWTADVEVGTAIIDRLGEVIQAIAAGHGARPRRVKPYPRPVLAIERARERRRAARHRSLVSRVMHRPPPAEPLQP